MRKKFLLPFSLITFSVILSHAQVQKIRAQTEELPNEFYFLPFDLTSSIEDISANGKYATGTSLERAFLWNIENTTSNHIDIQYLEEGSSGTAVSDNGIVAINILKYSESYASAGVWENGNAYSLGLGLLTQQDVDSGVEHTLGLPTTYAITQNGKMIVGQSPSKEHGGQTPYSWSKNDKGEWEELSWNNPNNMNIRITGISGNGTIACGNQSSLRDAIIWTSPSEGRIIDESALVQAHNISNNGKYVALRYNNRPAIYDVEKDKITILDENRWGTCLDVSDNGVAVGFYTNGVIGNDYKAFVWSEDFGFLDLTNYIATFANDVTIPAEIDFRPGSSFMKQVSSISADGTVIGGYHWGIVGNTSAMTAWILKINNPIDVYEKPKNLSAKISYPIRDKVVLTWDIPNGTDLFEVTGYKIYRNGNEIGELTSSDVYTYTDNNVPNGESGYEITAIYDNGKQSPKTETVSIYVYSIEEMQLPYIDDFESEGLNSYHWNAEPSHDAIWHIDYTNLTGFKGFALNCRIQGNATAYSASVVSRPFDATALDKVYLSYLYRVAIASGDMDFLDNCYVDLLDETDPSADWITINTISINPEKSIWENVETDISKYVAGKVFRIRFRTVGVSSQVAYVLLDNLQIRSTTGGAAPKKLIAQHTEGNVYLSWQDPSGTYKLSYCDLQPYQTAGDEQGKTIIGANKFEVADLLPYKGLILNSISTYFPTGISETTTYKIVIFEGETKIVEEEIYYETTGYWMTIPLSKPLTITAKEPLYIGIEASNYFNGEENEWPLYTDMSVSQYDGKGNLYSEDDGKTWIKLSDAGLTHNWCIVANVREENSYEEEIDNIWGYYVYRNGVRITENIIAAQSFLDETAEGDSNDYAVRAYYNDMGWSDPSEQLTVEINIIKNDDSVIVYPNPATERFYIEGIEGKANVLIMDVSGRILQKQFIQEKGYVSIHNLAAGMYIIQIYQQNKVYEKVLIKK